MAEGQELAERLHKRFSAVLVDTGYLVTCSMGSLAIEPCHEGTPLEELMSEADRLMYAAKRDGRVGLQHAVVADEAAMGLPTSAGGEEMMSPTWFHRSRRARSLAGSAPE